MDVIAGSWRKSSYSAYNGNCAEVASWRTSSHSAACGNCLEVRLPGQVVAGVRDARARAVAGPRLRC